jgi:hypothetical protein
MEDGLNDQKAKQKHVHTTWPKMAASVMAGCELYRLNMGVIANFPVLD